VRDDHGSWCRLAARFGSNTNVTRKKETYGAVAMQVLALRGVLDPDSNPQLRPLTTRQAQWTKALNLGHQRLTKDKPVDRQNPYTAESQVSPHARGSRITRSLISSLWLQLSLAQRMGLVECPAKALTKEEWKEVKDPTDP